jgi:hypothetical protein
MTKTKILVISDLHVGSESGIAPDEYTINDYQEDRSYDIQSNKIQKALYSKWIEMIDDVGKVDYLFLLGDLADGLNYKGQGIGITHNDLSWQEDLAIDLIKMIKVKYGNYIGVQGSAYHVGNQSGQDLRILKSLTRDAHSKFIFGDDVTEKIDGINFHLRHATSFSKIPELRKNALKRDLIEFMNEGNTLGKIDIAIRAHTHYYEHLDWNPYICGFVSPCWKGRDTFIRQKSVISPDNGYVTIDINDGEFEITPHLFKL